MKTTAQTKKATLHVSVDPVLSERLRKVCATMGLPVSHFTSLALSREVARFELEFMPHAHTQPASLNA